jgi:hypothetical protein
MALLNSSSLTVEKDSSKMKNVSSRLIISLNVTIHPGAPGSQSHFLLLPMTVHLHWGCQRINAR